VLKYTPPQRQCGIQNAPDAGECICGAVMSDPRKLMSELEANALDGLMRPEDCQPEQDQPQEGA
jgi:hypothetical protein